VCMSTCIHIQFIYERRAGGQKHPLHAKTNLFFSRKHQHHNHRIKRHTTYSHLTHHQALHWLVHQTTPALYPVILYLYCQTPQYTATHTIYKTHTHTFIYIYIYIIYTYTHIYYHIYIYSYIDIAI